MEIKKSKNANLHKAKKEKNDEFYTQLSDIENELKHYKKHFKNKTVMLPCDDPMESFFTIYFLQHFKELGLKRLICTCYKGSKVAFTQWTIFDYIDEIGGGEHKSSISSNGYVMDIKKVPEQIKESEIIKLLNKKGVVKKLKGDGDFRSDECLAYMEECDIVVTNPPFSLFREFVDILMKNNKKFVIWGNNNAINYKNVFSLIMKNKMWLGYISNQTCIFRLPNEYTIWDEKETKKRNDGFKYGKVPSISTFTNLDIDKRHEDLILYKAYRGNEKDYPKYDNYDAINVDKISDIPKDYKGIIGVPITFLDKYNPKQFEILGQTENLDLYKLKTRFYTTKECKERYFELFNKKGTYDLNASGVINGIKKYGRIFIRILKHKS